MTLEEAIKHLREVAEEQLRRSGKCIVDDDMCDKYSSCLKCAEEHEQLVEWLEELKIYRESNISIKNYQQGRADAIARIKKSVKNAIDFYNPSYTDIYNVITELSDVVIGRIEMFEEQLKG